MIIEKEETRKKKREQERETHTHRGKNQTIYFFSFNNKFKSTFFCQKKGKYIHNVQSLGQ